MTIIKAMKLDEYLTLIKKRPYVWANENGLNKTVIYNFLKGGKKLMLSTALAISKATKGAVSLEELGKYEKTNSQD